MCNLESICDGVGAAGRRPAEPSGDDIAPRGQNGAPLRVIPVTLLLLSRANDDAAQQRECETLIEAAGIGERGRPFIPNQHGAAHYDTLALMSKTGGGFIQALAEAWRHADSENHVRLYAAFEHYYTRYFDEAVTAKLAAAGGEG